LTKLPKGFIKQGCLDEARSYAAGGESWRGGRIVRAGRADFFALTWDSSGKVIRPREDAIGPIDRTERTQRVNEQIRITPVRVIGPDGAQLGVMPTMKALEAAREAGMDLVEVAAGERPPVCKIMDFGRFKYEAKKKSNKQKTHQVQVKEIRVRPKTGDEDIRVKVRRAREFLGHKDKVLVNVLFRGREMAHIEEGRRVMDEVLQLLEDVAKIEKSPSMEGRRMTAIVAPRT
jgi:translation initiation factor IF-3